MQADRFEVTSLLAAAGNVTHDASRTYNPFRLRVVSTIHYITASNTDVSGNQFQL